MWNAFVHESMVLDASRDCVCDRENTVRNSTRTLSCEEPLVDCFSTLLYAELESDCAYRPSMR